MDSGAKDRRLHAYVFKVLGRLVMTSGDLAAVNYTIKKTTACRALRILGRSLAITTKTCVRGEIFYS
jgi:hypothetical protein